MFFSFFLNSSIYNINFEAIDGSSISMSKFSGKRILITSFNSKAKDISILKKLDLLQKEWGDSLTIIVIPAFDFDPSTDVRGARDLRDSMTLNLIMTMPMHVKKSAKQNQDKIFKWLTNMSENDHFNRDVQEEDQLFVISKKGILYGILDKETPISIVKKVLSQMVIE